MAATATFRKTGEAEDDTTPELWDRVCCALVRHSRLFVFADFDGTLSQMADVPSRAVLTAEAEQALRRLAAAPRVSVVVMSGRSVDDVASRVGLPITYFGESGLQIHAPDVEFTVAEAESAAKKLPELCNRIREEIQDTPGALVEAKRLTASVHYRHVVSDRVPLLMNAVDRCVSGTDFEVLQGNCAFDVRPRVNWTKADAVAWLLSRQTAVPQQVICIGGDHTVEALFQRFPAAVNVRVTVERGVSTAASYLLGTDEVARMLNGVADVAEGIC